MNKRFLICKLFTLMVVAGLFSQLRATGILRDFTETCFKKAKEFPYKRSPGEGLPVVMSVDKFEKTLDNFLQLFAQNDQLSFTEKGAWIDKKAPSKELITKIPDDSSSPTMFDVLEKEKLNFRHPYSQKLIVPSNSLVCTFGDLHGSIHSLIRSLWRLYLVGFIDEDLSIKKENGHMIFLGDYVDRGRYCVEVLYLLMQLKIKNPTKVFLLRGNHEDPLMGGTTIRDEIKTKYGTGAETNKLLWKLACLYDVMPHVLYLGCNKNFVQYCHGGIDPSYNPKKLLMENDEKIIYESLLGKKETSDLLPDEVRNQALEHFRMSESITVNPDPEDPENSFFAVGLNWGDFARSKSSKDNLIYNESEMVFSGHGYSASVKVANEYLNGLNQQLKSGGCSLRQIIRGHAHTNFGISLLDDTFPIELKFSWGDIDAKVRDWAGVVSSDEITSPFGFNLSKTKSPVVSFLSAPEGVGKDVSHGMRLKFGKDCFGILRTHQKWEHWFLKPFDFQVKGRDDNGLYCSLDIGYGEDPLHVSFSSESFKKNVLPERMVPAAPHRASYGLEPDIFEIARVERAVEEIFKKYKLERLKSGQLPISQLQKQVEPELKSTPLSFPVPSEIKTQSLNHLRAISAIKNKKPLTKDLFTKPLTDESFNEIVGENNEVRETCLNILNQEKNLQDKYYAFYHGYHPGYSILFDVYQQIYSFGLIKKDQPLALRVLSGNAPQSLEKFLDKALAIPRERGLYTFFSRARKQEKTGWFDNIPVVGRQLLAVNFSLFGNETMRGESSFGYAEHMHSGKKPTLGLLEEVFDFCFIKKNFLSKIIFLNDKFLQHRSRKSVLLQIFLDKNVVDHTVYIARAGGRPVDSEVLSKYLDVSKKWHTNISPFLRMFVADPLQLNLELQQFYHRGLLREYRFGLDKIQGRIWLPSQFLYDPTHTKIFRHSLSRLNDQEKENEKTFVASLTKMFEAIVKDSIRSKLLEQMGYEYLKETPFELFEQELEKELKPYFQAKQKRLLDIYGVDAKAGLHKDPTVFGGRRKSLVKRESDADLEFLNALSFNNIQRAQELQKSFDVTKISLENQIFIFEKIVEEKLKGLDDIFEVVLKKTFVKMKSENIFILLKVSNLLSLAVKKEYKIVYDIAAKLAYESSKRGFYDASKISLNLFTDLFNKGYEGAYGIAGDSALEIIKSKDQSNLVIGFALFKLLFENGRGFEKAFEAVKILRKDETFNIREIGLNLLEILIEKDHAPSFVLAEEIATNLIKTSDFGEGIKGLQLFSKLFEKRCGFEVARKAASWAVSSDDFIVRPNGLVLFSYLVQAGYEDAYPEAKKAAELIMTTGETNDRMIAEMLLKKLQEIEAE